MIRVPVDPFISMNLVKGDLVCAYMCNLSCIYNHQLKMTGPINPMA